MVAVFAVFATLSMTTFKQLGVGLAVAILLDATVVRAVLLPSVLAVLGDRTWWLPRWLSWLPDRSGAEPVPQPTPAGQLAGTELGKPGQSARPASVWAGGGPARRPAPRTGRARAGCAPG